MSRTVAEALRAGAGRLAELDAETARLDAELLMAHALGCSRSEMLTTAMRDTAPERFDRMIARRLKREPVAHIVGSTGFWGRDFVVSTDVLIPRGDTEVLVAAALAEKPDARAILDLGTGSGALLVTMLCEFHKAVGVGVDASQAALDMARNNAKKHGADGRSRFLQADWTKPAWRKKLGRYDLVLCNPPYVEEDAELDDDVREYEPAAALFAGTDGLDDYRVLLPQLGALLSEDGVALFEIGHEQAEPVVELAKEARLFASLKHDLAGRPRCVMLRRGTSVNNTETRGLAKGARGATS